MNQSNALRSRALCSAASILALGAAFLTAPGAALAQDTNAVGEVVVTASRIQSAGFTAPTPTSVIGAAEIARRAPVTILEAVNDIPSFRPSSTPQNSASTTNGAIGNPGSSLVDLRGLGNARTLLLINGHRTGGSQDLGQFPTILVQRIDVVTGGASAAYGSDAVAGVVNIVLDTNFSGLKGDAQYGQSKYGDDETWNASLAWGGSFFNDRAHLLVGGSYMDEKGALTANPVTSDPRPWIAANRGAAFSNPCPLRVAVSAACPTGGNGLSPFVDLDQHNFATMNPGGIIISGPLKGITFEDGGIPRQFQYGIVLGASQIGGEGQNPSQFALRPNLNRYTLMGRFDFALTDTTNLWAEYTNVGTSSHVPSSAFRDQGNLTIQRDNAFIPASIRAEMVRLNLTTLTMGRFNNDRAQPNSTNHNSIFRYAGGLEGTFPAIGKTWNWDVYAQYGIAHSNPQTYGSRNTDKWLFALDSVINAQGVPACRAVVANNPNAAGCVPFNIFGPNAASDAAIAYIKGNQSSNTDTEQTNAAFNIRGEPFSLWAGPIALAFGGEYRKEKITTTSDPLSQLGKWDSGNTKALSGNFNVKEVYAELAVPLAKDMVLARSIDLNGAVRYADYSSVRKGVTTWKIGGTWEPVQEILLRTTWSKDIRAPSINNLFAPGGTSRNNVVQRTGPFAGQNQLVDFTSAGNPNLTQENANTWTAGFSLRPKFARLRFSADYFSIKIKDQIGTLSTQGIIDLCTVSGRSDFCSLITFDAARSVVSVLNTSVNNARFTTRGWDLEASYVQPLNELPFLSLPGTLTGRAFATKVLEYAQIDQTGYVERSGQNAATLPGTTNVPEWVANYTLSYEVGKFTGGVQFRYIGPGVLEKTSITGTSTERMENKISSQTVTNFSANYRLIDGEGRRLTLFGAVNNAFNRGTPFPIFPLTQNGYGYDNLGMVWRAGLRFQY